MRSTPLVAVALAMLAATARAQAPTADAHARADALFEEGRRLMNKGDYIDACPRFEESQQLDPALGTLLNLGLCVEGMGKIGRALAIWRDAEEQARRGGETKRAATAAEHIAALEPRVPTLTISIETPTPGLHVTVGGHDVPAASWGKPLPLDPGDVAITADAPGHEPFATTTTLHEKDRATVAVPALAASATSSGPPATPAARHARRPIAYGLAGGGVALVGGGVLVGLSAKSKYDGAFNDGHCDRASLACDDAGQSATDAARKRGTYATVIGVVGLAAIAAGVIVYVTDHGAGEEPQHALVPTISPDGAGLAVVGTF